MRRIGSARNRTRDKRGEFVWEVVGSCTRTNKKQKKKKNKKKKKKKGKEREIPCAIALSLRAREALEEVEWRD